jgi:hypothetical protein
MITYFIRKLINGCHVWIKVTTSIETWKMIPRAVGITILCSSVPVSLVNLPEKPIVNIPIVKSIENSPNWIPSEIWNFPPREDYGYLPNIPLQRHWIDSPSVEIPEPMTMGIFVIGCILLLLIKRK